MLSVESAEVMEEKSAETGEEWSLKISNNLRRSDLRYVIFTALTSEASWTLPMIS